MEISTVYDLGMPKALYVQMFSKEGVPNPPIRIKADKFENNAAGRYIIKLGNEIVGEFNAATVAGWWIQDE